MKTTKTATKKVTAKAGTAKAAKVTKPAKATKAPKPTAKADAKKLSQIEAAIQVLAEAGEPMNCKAMVEAMTAQGLWSSPGGATPDATLYSSILRDINTKGKDARFKKTDRGHFTLSGK
ncbi:MAG: winged helix-turn-helix domain-containing protein [Pirellulaceae bacterium]|nr:winged helix-turn-helix domain-containing protein [Pirellulaceae bacterium]